MIDPSINRVIGGPHGGPGGATAGRSALVIRARGRRRDARGMAFGVRGPQHHPCPDPDILPAGRPPEPRHSPPRPPGAPGGGGANAPFSRQRRLWARRSGRGGTTGGGPDFRGSFPPAEGIMKAWHLHPSESTTSTSTGKSSGTARGIRANQGERGARGFRKE